MQGKSPDTNTINEFQSQLLPPVKGNL